LFASLAWESFALWRIFARFPSGFTFYSSASWRTRHLGLFSASFVPEPFCPASAAQIAQETSTPGAECFHSASHRRSGRGRHEPASEDRGDRDDLPQVFARAAYRRSVPGGVWLGE